MKRIYWLFFAVIIGGIVVLLWPRDGQREMLQVQTGAASGVLAPTRSSEFRVPPAEETAAFVSERWAAHTPLGPDHRRVAGEAASVGKSTATHQVPAVFLAFDQWMRGQVAALVSDRPARLAEGRALLAARQALWPDFARANPEAALLLAPSPVARGILPPDMAGQLEQIISGEGFYGLKAICNHDLSAEHGAGCRIEHEVFIGGRSYQASIYGSRAKRLTEESASIYGVALDGVLALHEDDVVVLSAATVVASASADQLALIHRGKTTLVPESQLESALKSLLTP
jgi:hypothetical protein